MLSIMTPFKQKGVSTGVALGLEFPSPQTTNLQQLVHWFILDQVLGMQLQDITIIAIIMVLKWYVL